MTTQITKNNQENKDHLVELDLEIDKLSERILTVVLKNGFSKELKEKAARELCLKKEIITLNN